MLVFHGNHQVAAHWDLINWYFPCYQTKRRGGCEHQNIKENINKYNKIKKEMKQVG